MQLLAAALAPHRHADPALAFTALAHMRGAKIPASGMVCQV